METEVKTRVRTNGKSRIFAKKMTKGNKLAKIYGCFKGQIFCDDAIFNLGVKQNHEAVLH